jgi:hypothetical protein
LRDETARPGCARGGKQIIRPLLSQPVGRGLSPGALIVSSYQSRSASASAGGSADTFLWWLNVRLFRRRNISGKAAETTAASRQVAGPSQSSASTMALRSP